jgi:DNA-directed RNA polymerase subunit K
MPAKKTSTKKATSKKFTRFEKARILGSRAIQLSMGAKPLVKVTEDLDPIDIALAELKADVLPLNVKPKD